MGHRRQVAGLGRGKADLSDQPKDLVGVERGHLLWCRRPVEERRGDLVHLFVGGLRRQGHRHQQRVGVAVIERDRRFRVEPIEDLADPIGLVTASHGDHTPAAEG